MKIEISPPFEELKAAAERHVATQPLPGEDGITISQRALDWVAGYAECERRHCEAAEADCQERLAKLRDMIQAEERLEKLRDMIQAEKQSMFRKSFIDCGRGDK